jgi:hypothetical protein
MGTRGDGGVDQSEKSSVAGTQSAGWGCLGDILDSLLIFFIQFTLVPHCVRAH